MAFNAGLQFSTTDRDNDGDMYYDCAEVYGRGGWWYYGYRYCTLANLNGVYHQTPSTTDKTGIYWWRWHGYKYSLKATTMMIQKT